jgi:heme-degrading monooxygenase HmoA
MHEPEAFWLVTYWKDQESFQSWHRSHSYKASHEGIPAGLKLVPGRNQVLLFEHIAS